MDDFLPKQNKLVDLSRVAGQATIPYSPWGTAVIDGDPNAGSVTIDHFRGLTIGVWETTAGVVEDVEGDELFVVLSGRAEVELLDTEEVLELVPGSIVRLSAGQRTRWIVHDTLRKLFLAE